MSAPVGRWMLVAAGVLVAATLLAALWTMESPSKQRDRRLDQRRAEELGQIASTIDAWYSQQGRLPASLTLLANQPGLLLAITDPVSGDAYTYDATSERGYRLCAVFATSTADKGPDANAYGWQDKRWLHPVGRHCFDREVEAPRKASVEP